LGVLRKGGREKGHRGGKRIRAALGRTLFLVSIILGNKKIIDKKEKRRGQKKTNTCHPNL
jgi:hypothetical protein